MDCVLGAARENEQEQNHRHGSDRIAQLVDQEGNLQPLTSTDLDMFLQVLRTLESLATEITFVRLQGDMDTYVRGYMVTLDGGCSAGAPLTSKVQVVRALSTDMSFTYMVLVLWSAMCVLLQKEGSDSRREPRQRCTSHHRSPIDRQGCLQRRQW